ncbi:hypothetical protein [Neptunomonas marina]|uniref:CR-type domain-containing protein n=1 Tax=Neptunomonas marina TaxID=1815562 RepID=A0A437QDV6_9GAMM|nr:hypothetical protein [Neptunomonas marina]RVU32676.1 hypothetical protein EOE65_03200 [Neptunomonas marina]
MNSVDLKHWCAGEDDRRTYLREPMLHKGFAVATNGHVIILVPVLEGSSAGLATPNAGVARFIDAHGFTEMQELNPLSDSIQSPEMSTCTECEGTGHVTDLTCRECNGKGTVEFENAYNDYKVECASCNGSGKTRLAGECTACNATGKRYRDHDFVDIEGIKIQPKYFNLLKSLPGNLSVQGAPPSRMLYFHSTEGMRGAIMGMDTV